MHRCYEGDIRLVLFDVDGVLTDGILHIGENGELFKNFNAKDGVAVALLKAHGIKTGFISGKSSKALDYRAKQLGIDFYVSGRHDKLNAFEEIARVHGFAFREVAFVGDDIIDLEIMLACGISYAPADAHPLVSQFATRITKACGGSGVAREVAEHILADGGIDLESAYRPLLKNWEKLNAKQ